MKTIYIPGDQYSFKAYVDAHYADHTIELRNIDGKNRWVVKDEDGEEYIVRPWETKPQ